jgi:hypothetical protein
VGSRGETAAGSWVRRGRQWGARARRRRDHGCVEGGSGEPGRDGDKVLGASREAVGSRGRDGGRRCWGETNLIRIIIDIFSTILYIK